MFLPDLQKLSSIYNMKQFRRNRRMVTFEGEKYHHASI